MSDNGRALTAAEQRDLDRLAKGSDFFSRLRAAYAEWGSLTPRQYEALKNAREKDSWRNDALMVGTVPVKNRYEKAGKPKCAHRGKPYCDDVATVVVGSFGYCSEHADEARESLDVWKKEHPRKPAGGVGSQDFSASERQSADDPMHKYMGRDDLDDVPF